MKIYQLLIIALLAVTFAACSGSEEPANSNTAAIDKDVPANPAPPANAAAPQNNVITQPETDVIPRTGEIKSLKTPTEAYKTFAVATINKDVATIKQSISKGSLQFIEASAKQQNKTVEEMFIGGEVENIERKIPEIRNEKIEGDTATIEVKNEMGIYDTIPLIKENGEWKVALDELYKSVQRKFEEMKERLSEIK